MQSWNAGASGAIGRREGVNRNRLALPDIGRTFEDTAAMRADIAADRAVAAQGLVHDALDGAHTTSAFRRAAETSVHLPGRARRVFARLAGGADIAVTQDVAGTNNHGPADN